jgi:hypothetical protein
MQRLSSFLPPSTNAAYYGSRYAAWFLAFYGVAWIVPGMIHSFLPDGGAGTIAGLDLGHNPTMIFGLFAWAGATQIAHGIVTLIVALRYRTLVPLFLLVSLIERLLVRLGETPPRKRPPPARTLCQPYFAAGDYAISVAVSAAVTVLKVKSP